MSTKKLPPLFARGLFVPNPDLAPRRSNVRAPKPMCPCCWQRPSAPDARGLCDARGRKISGAGLCETCAARPQLASKEERETQIMQAEAAATCAHLSPASETTVLAAAADHALYQQHANDAWHNDDMLLAELLELRERFAAMGKEWPRPPQFRELALRIDQIERDSPFLEDPDFGLADAPPFPDAL